ncbi:MAG: TonB-dependent receptor [Arcicella sp.]|nr:TonB-dependent receptor [Arcicella sp.]
MKNFKSLLHYLFSRNFAFARLAGVDTSHGAEHPPLSRRSGGEVLAIATFLLIAHCSLLTAQSISGKITDSESGKTLSGTTVTLENSTRGTITNQQGFYSIKNLQKGSYILKISYLGFEKIEQIIDLKKDETFDFKLQKSTFVADEVIVSATRANAKSAMAYSDISKEYLQKQNLGQDIPQLLNFTPSLVTTSDAGAGVGYTGIRIRGTDATRINVTVNGIPINDSESQGTFWVNMPDLASSTNSVQIQRGVGTSTNGAGAFGATVNLSTNEFRKKAYLELNNSFGSFNTWKNTIMVGSGLLKNKFTIDGRLSRISSDGYVDRATSDLKSIYLSGAYFGKKSFVRFNVLSGKEKTYQAWEGVPENLLETNRTFNLYTYENQTDNYRQDHYQLLSSHNLSANWTLNFNLHYTKGAGYYEQFKEADKFERYGLPNVINGNNTLKKTDFIRRKWLDNDFYGTTFSLDYQGNNKISANIGGGFNQYDGDHFGEVTSAKDAPNVPVGYRWYENNAIKKDFNLYGKINYSLTEKMGVFADLQVRTINYSMKGIADKRQDITQATDFAFFNPKLGLTYQLSDNSNLYASYSVGNKEPNRSDFVDNAPKAPLSEHLEDLEVGYKTQKSNVAFSVNGYLMNYTNQLVLTGKLNDVGEAIRTNVSDSYRMGVEIEAGIKVSNSLKINTNLTLSNNKIKNFEELIPNYDGGENQLNKFPETNIAFSPSTILGSQIIYNPLKNLEFSWLSKYVGKQYLDNTTNENRKLNAYFTNDLRGIYTLKVKTLKEVNFTFLVNNLFNTLYESNGYTYSYIYEKQVVTENFYYPQAGTNFMLGMNLKF